MPIIRIDFDRNQISSEKIAELSTEIRDIVSTVTGIEDVFVYAQSPEIVIKAAPIEIFVEMSAHKIKDVDKLTADLVSEIKIWKQKSGFATPINLTVIPMSWKIELGI